MSIRHFLALAVLPLGCTCACTVIAVGDGHRVTMVRPGVIQIMPAPGASLLTYRVRGLGLVPGRSGPTLGWAREDAVLFYDLAQCRIIMIDPPISAETKAFWAQFLKDHSDICVAGGKP